MIPNNLISRVGITPVGSGEYRLNRLRFHLLAYSIARKEQLEGHEAKFIIRCDDTNEANVDRSFLDPYLEVLESLGVKADLDPYDVDQTGGSLFQSKRKDIYARYCEQLIDKKLAFQDATGAIFFDTIKFFEEFDERLQDGKIVVSDLSMGKIKVDPKIPINDGRGKNDLVPFPIRRANGDYLFNLCSPVDDAVMGVTHIVRDRTKLSLLPQQEMIRVALGLPETNYLHAPLLVNKEGKRLVHDDQLGEATLQNFTRQGFMPHAVISYLLSGFYGPSECYYESIDDFCGQVDFAKVHQSNAIFSHAVLDQHNKKALVKVSDKEYKKALKDYKENQLGYEEEGSDALLDVMAKVRRKLPETTKIMDCIKNPEFRMPSLELAKIVKSIFDLFSQWQNQAGRVSFEEFFIDECNDKMKDLGVSKKDYFTAIRFILTGEEHGIDLKLIIKYLESQGLIVGRFRSTILYIGAEK